MQDSEEELSLGTGLIVTTNGYIFTNYVISGEENSICYVTLYSGAQYTGKVIYTDKNLDIAIIKIYANNLSVPKICDSSAIEIGEEVYGLSNAFGYDIFEEAIFSRVKALKRTIKFLEDEEYLYANEVFQTESTLYKNEIIVNENGDVLGIYSKKIEAVVSLDRFKNIIESLENTDSFEEVNLGIYGFDNKELKYINSEYDLENGVLIDKIEAGSILNEYLKVGDIVLKIDDYEVSSFEDIKDYLSKKQEAEVITFEILRDSKILKVEWKVEKKIYNLK